jgi:hypothetical protein
MSGLTMITGAVELGAVFFAASGDWRAWGMISVVGFVVYCLMEYLSFVVNN